MESEPSSGSDYHGFGDEVVSLLYLHIAKGLYIAVLYIRNYCCIIYMYTLLYHIYIYR